MPNLAIVNSSRKGFMIHRAGCRDLLRLNPLFEEVWTEEHDSVQSVVESVYGDMMPEDQQPWTYYEPDFRFFPCCPPLPRESVPVRTMWVIEMWGDAGGWTTVIDQIETREDAEASLAGAPWYGRTGMRVSERPWEA